MMNTLTKTAPPEIHLCIADDADEDYEAFPYDAIDEISSSYGKAITALRKEAVESVLNYLNDASSIPQRRNPRRPIQWHRYSSKPTHTAMPLDTAADNEVMTC